MKMMMLEEFSSDRAGLAQTMERVQIGQAVCRADVEPYIRHFPMQYSLGSFTDHPSAYNLEVALEGFAALLKETAKGALSAIAEECVQGFVRVGQSKGTAIQTAGRNLENIHALLDTQTMITSAPGYQVKAATSLGGNALSAVTGLRFKGELNYAAFASEFYSDKQNHDMLVAAEGVVAAIAYGEFPGVTETLAQPLTDYLGDLSKRLDEVRSAVQSSTKRLNAGDVRGGAGAFERIDLTGPRGHLLSLVSRAYDRFLPSPKSIQPPNSPGLLNDRVKSMTDLFEGNARALKGRYTASGKALDDWRTGTITEPLTRLQGASTVLREADNTKTGRLAKTLGRECEVLQRRVSETEFTAESETALMAILEEVRMDAASAAALFELIGLEQRLVASYLSVFLKKQAALAAAVALFTRPSDQTLARKLEGAGKLSAKLAGKSH